MKNHTRTMNPWFTEKVTEEKATHVPLESARWDPENPAVAGNPRTAPSCTTYQPVILANAGIQTIGESDDRDEDSRQALVSSECGAPFCWLLIFGDAKKSHPSAGRNRLCKSNSRSEHQQNIQDNRR